MSYEQLLHDYVDGSLDYQDEMRLFNELRTNEALRQELKLLILMQKSARHDVEAFTPAPDSHDVIFARLGFAPGLVERSVPLAYARRWGTGGGYLQGIIGGIVGAIITAFILIAADRYLPAAGGRDASLTSPAGVSAAQPIDREPRPAPAGDGAALPAEATGAPAMPSLSALRDDRPAASRPARRTARSVETDRSLSAAEMEPARFNATEVTMRSIEQTAPVAASSRPMPESPAAMAEVAPTFESDGPSPISTEYRAIASRDFMRRPDALANPSDALFHNRAIAVQYRLGETQRIGLEIGEENFYQRFDEMLPNGDLLRHEQNPAMIWGGVSFTQILWDGSRLRPYVRGLVGGTRLGPVGRVTLGTSYEVGPSLQLFAGGEVSALAYRFDGGWLLSPKYGVAYGLALGF